MIDKSNRSMEFPVNPAACAFMLTIISLVNTPGDAIAKQIRLLCNTNNTSATPTIILLDTDLNRVWTQGVDGKLHQRTLKSLTKESLVVGDNSLIDSREYDTRREDKLNLYIEQKATYKVNRIDGFMEFEIEVRNDPNLPFKRFYESGKCETIKNMGIF